MKKNQLSKLALMGLATGAMISSTVTLSANTVVETKGTYLAGGCGGAGKCGGSNKSNPSSYTADNFAPVSNSAVNPNMAPKPESLQTNPAQVRQPQAADVKPQSGCGASKSSGGQGSCGSAKPVNGQAAPSHGCGGSAPAGGQVSSSCGSRSSYNR